MGAPSYHTSMTGILIQTTSSGDFLGQLAFLSGSGKNFHPGGPKPPRNCRYGGHFLVFLAHRALGSVLAVLLSDAGAPSRGRRQTKEDQRNEPTDPRCVVRIFCP